MLMIDVGSHPDELVARLCEKLTVPPADPFAREMVAVPTRGVERWLTQRIASGLGRLAPGDGVCANVAFPSPNRLVREVLVAVPELAAGLDAWEGPLLTRSVLATIDDHMDESWMWLLARFIDAPDAGVPMGNSQRLRAATKIARLFTSYARRRPAMLRAWVEGSDLGPDGRALPEAQQWQPALWRLVRRRIGIPGMAELLPEALVPIRDGTVDPGLPRRVFVYGLTAVDPVDLQVFEALAATRSVYLYLLHPSPVLKRQAARQLEEAGIPTTGLPRDRDPTMSLPRHPLLASWARDCRELQLVLAARDLSISDRVDDSVVEAPTLLSQLQHDIRSNSSPTSVRVPAGVAGPGADRSVQIQVCHGARRQVEVLRDAILHLLASDHTLEPRDVVIMTPDLATFAPLLEAAFLRDVTIDSPPADGRTAGDEEESEEESLPDLRVRIADRAPAANNPLVRFAATVLDLVDSRLEAGVVRELIAMPSVRQLFGLDEEEADAISALIDDIQVRWGLDAVHRDHWDAGPYDEQTWRRALDRTMAGVFYSDSRVRVVENIAPVGGVEGQEAKPAGHLAQLIDRIVAVRDLVGKPRPHSQWGPAISTAVRLLAAPDWDAQWQWSQLERLLEETFPTEPDGPDDPLINPAEARLAVDGWSRDAPSPLHFRTGDITVCTLVPMRSVPYRVVCLLGMDDDRFPRPSRNDGDDLLVDHQIVGDHDRATEDRQLLMDAVMAAGDHLIVTYSGRDELTSAEYPPAVPIAELIDVLREMMSGAGLVGITTHHPLQPFSESNFVPGRLGLAGPWGFDPRQLEGARALQRRGTGAPLSLALPISPTPTPSEIGIHELCRFLEHPAREVLRTRFGFVFPPAGEVSDDTVPTRLDPLGEWMVTDRLLGGLLDDLPIEALEAHERASDAVPPGGLGRKGLERSRDRAEYLSRAAEREGYDRGRHQQFTGAVQVGAHRVEGSVIADLGNDRLDVVTPSRLKGKHRLRAFVTLVFLTAVEPNLAWRALLIGRHFRGDKLWRVEIGPLGQDRKRRQPDPPSYGQGKVGRRKEAERLLSGLVDLYVEGMSEPFPLPCETAFTWQRKGGSNRPVNAFPYAQQTWEKDHFAPEAADPANTYLFPGLVTMRSLADSRFPEYAERLWAPILPLLREKAI